MWGLMPGVEEHSHVKERSYLHSCVCWHDMGGQCCSATGLYGSEYVGMLGHVLPEIPSLR